MRVMPLRARCDQGTGVWVCAVSSLSGYGRLGSAALAVHTFTEQTREAQTVSSWCRPTVGGEAVSR